MKRQTGVTEPLRDWFPLSASSALSDVTDLLKGPGADWGTLKCGCHPDCGIGTAFMVSKKTKEWAPLVVVHQRRALPARTPASIADAARGPVLTKLQTALSLLRNYSPARRRAGFRLVDLLHKFDKQSGGQLGGRLGARDNGDRKQDEWLLMFVAGMWFQDLWTYDFRRTEMCIIPYATQMGEISFCAYNTGVGWRQIVENMYQNATVAEWYREHGKHPVYANPRKAVPLPAGAQPVSLQHPARRPAGRVDAARAPRRSACAQQSASLRRLTRRAPADKRKGAGVEPAGPLHRGSGRRRYSTSFSCVSSAAMRSERRKRRSLALISNGAALAAGAAFCGARDLRRARPGCRAIDESDDRLERHLHLEPCGAGALAARLDSGIFGDGGGNGVGQLSCDPVHDVIHSGTSSPPPELGRRGVSPTRSCTPARAAEIGRQMYAY